MKKIILILSFLFMGFTTFAGKVVVIEVNKSDAGWQGILNLYGRVTTTHVGCVNGIAQVRVDCFGSGWIPCRAASGIMSMNCDNTIEIPDNPILIDAINALIALSEEAAERKQCTGSASKKVAVVDRSTGSQMYFIKAEWKYDTKNAKNGKITITISIPDKNNNGNDRIF